MRFIVDIYRYVILGGIALAIIALVYGALKIGAASAEYGTLFIIYGVVALLVFVLSLGATAIVVSIHDRHAELVDELRAIRIQLESR